MPHALLVEDDESMIETIRKSLRSMGHTCDVAMDQEKAEELLANNAYDYFLLDLVIPLYQKGLVDKQYGRNLLIKIKETPGHRDRPVIVITAHDLDTFKTGVDVMKLGAFDYVAKPFTSENPLEDKIREALKTTKRAGGARAEREGEGPSEPFSGGYLDFYTDRIELCGEKIAGPEGQSKPRMVLDLLKRRHVTGERRNYDARFIAQELGFERGPDAVSDAIFQIRESCTRAMERQAVRVEKNDVICNRHRGYLFAPGIEIRDHTGKTEQVRLQDHTENQLAILRELRRESALSRSDLASLLHLTVRAIDAEIAPLIAQGDVVQEGSGAAMRYKLASNDASSASV